MEKFIKINTGILLGLLTALNLLILGGIIFRIINIIAVALNLVDGIQKGGVQQFAEILFVVPGSVLGIIILLGIFSLITSVMIKNLMVGVFGIMNTVPAMLTLSAIISLAELLVLLIVLLFGLRASLFLMPGAAFVCLILATPIFILIGDAVILIVLSVRFKRIYDEKSKM